ncbi:hypothetical protein [Spiroplasma endosymbiont of Nomada ruficornis]|uniref:hypothetical protein n=1 Tax=Spiroplasma endosymbiont of Nomada ruficornis TaxID=3066325 RepID=UPI00313AB11A
MNNVVNHGFKSNQLNKNLTMINSPFINDFQDLKNKKNQKVIIAPNGIQYMQEVAQLVYEKVLME